MTALERIDANISLININLRLKIKTRDIDGHKIWVGFRTEKDYGLISFMSRHPTNHATVLVHRLAYYLYVDKNIATNGLNVLHKCDKPPCWEPTHLFMGTQGDNNRDMSEKGRHFNSKKTHCPQGHEYNEENTCLSNGARYCRVCIRIDTKRRYHVDKEIQRLKHKGKE